MAVYPRQVFTQENALVGFNEDYKSSPLGKKFAGQPKGVYVGFAPTTAGSVLSLETDTSEGYSVVKVPSQADPSGLDIITDQSIALDFSSQTIGDFPMQVLARASYMADGSVPTTAEIFSRSGSATPAFDEVLICVVDGPPGAISARFDASLGERDEPLAFSGVNFGFMPGGSIEDLQAAADIVDEVVAARQGFDGTDHPDLDARISEDYSAESMAGRLSPLFRALRSNDYAVSAGDSSVVVSGSFTEIDRDFGPELTLSGNGDETTVGAVAAPNDSIRNVAIVVDADTGYRPVDDPTDRRIVFARIEGPNETAVGGTWTFTNALTDVSGADGQATTEMEVGDTILGADGKYYEIETIIDNNNIELRTAYQGPTATVDTQTIRRWQLRLKKINDLNVEVDASFASQVIVRFFFPAFVSMEQSNFDWKMAMHTAGEREPLPSASTTVPGAVRLATSGARLGAVKIQNAGVPVGGGPFHTINFSAPNASVVTVSGSPGEVEVVEIGPQGATGPPGASGGPGPPGGPGPGYSALNTFELSSEFAGVSGSAMMFSFTRDMGHNIRYLHGNVARFRDFGSFVSTQDPLEILDVTAASATEGKIDVSLGTSGSTNDHAATLFLSSAGD